MPTDTDQQQFAEQLARQLKGLDMPESVSWWPLAIGWWFVIVLCLLILFYLAYKITSKIKQYKYREIAINELQIAFNYWQQDNSTVDYLQTSNSILKRVIKKLEHASNMTNVNKSGGDWSTVLQHYSKRPLSELTLSALSYDCYQANPDIDIPHVHEQIKTWLSSHEEQQNA